MIERIPITNREQWLGLRKRDVTASVVGAMFGVHPYYSALRLYIEKQGLIELPGKADTGPMRRGRILESAVAAAVAEQRPEWEIKKAASYYRDAELRLGCTPDFYINGAGKIGVLQAKTAAPSVYEREWRDGQPPLWITLQLATEMMLVNAEFGAVAVLVVDPFDLPCHIVDVPRHAATEQKIREAAVKFWHDVEHGNEPNPEYGVDKDLIAALAPRETPESSIDLSGNNEVIAGLFEREMLKAQVALASNRCREIEALIMDRMRDYAVAKVPGFHITWKTEKRRAYEVPAWEKRVLRIKGLDKGE